MNNQLDLFAVLGAYQSARDVVALLLSLICDSKLRALFSCHDLAIIDACGQ